jgi:AbrB family looped-hinge helix DNA binding protein
MIATVTTKGQITIPAEIRKKFNISAKDRVDFIADGERIILVPVKTLQDFRGAVKGVVGVPEKERQAARDALSRRIVKEME